MRRLLLIVACCTLPACGDATLDPLPLDISMEASTTSPTVGDTVNFLVRAQGGSLLGVDISFGDGSVDQYATGGARTARVTFKHVYLTVGTVQVLATVTDAVAGPRDVLLQLAVN
ncbi:MAG TPA: hypothetical protein VFT29_08805 [Gemmatimonadaceae bacterium]|nr:hypothetical protein [Gemmatimonadaceae bacterium]